MKAINSETGFLAYQKIFSTLLANKLYLITWQVHPESGERQRCDSRISAYNMESKSIHLEQSAASSVRMDQKLGIYFYSDDAQLIFKCTPQEVRENFLSVDFPSEIKLLDETDVAVMREKMGLPKNDNFGKYHLGGDELDDIMRVKSMSQRSSRDQEFLNQEFHPVSLDEEEKMFAGQRETPRARPKKDKKVKILINNEVTVFKLFDLSQGGMGFLTNQAGQFNSETQIQIVGFDEFLLDDPLIGTVKSVRQIEGVDVEFKVGVKFHDGQN